MSGLRFESMANMPPGLRQIYTKQVFSGQAKGSIAAPAEEKIPKYHNEKTEIGKINFDSKKEAHRYGELIMLLRAGKITDLRLQPQFTLQESYKTELGERVRAVRYTADFSYRDNSGQLIVEDVKSGATRTKEYLRNRKFMRDKFGIDIQEV